MELKYRNTAKRFFMTYSFNRTFMELKLLDPKLYSQGVMDVLIVPLWN